MQALLWWALLTISGWAALPLMSHILKTPDNSLALAHVLGLALTTFTIWLITVVSPIPFSQATVLIVIALLLAVSFWAWFRDKSLTQQVKQSFKSLLVVELLFAASFVACLAFRASLPAATHTEQPMDMAMLSSLLRSSAMPPADPWLSGHTINYYYGGYLQIALVAKATGASAGAAYNLGLAQVFALAVTSLYGLIKQLLPASQSTKTRIALAALGSLSIMLSGNLASLLQLAESVGIFPTAVLNWLSLPSIGSTGDYWWWFNASRIAQDTNVFGRLATLITEFPSFGFILGDLHPHLVDLPLFTAGLALCLQIGSRPHKSFKTLVCSVGFWVAAVLLALVAITNSWDLPTLLFVYALVVLPQERQKHPFWRALWQTTKACALLGITASVLASPFFVQFEAPTGGIGISYYAFSDIALYVLMFGVWLLPIALLFARRRAASRTSLTLALIILGTIVLGVILLGGWADILLSAIGMSSGGLLWIALLLCLASLLANSLQPQQPNGTTLIRSLLTVALAISLFAEWFYLQDSFNTRMNTLFKVYEQVWIILGVVGIASLAQLIAQHGWKRTFAWVAASLMLLSCTYTWQAVETRLAQESVSPSIDGTAWLQNANAQEYEALVWLDEHAGEGDVLIEAWGDEYAANESRFAAITGVSSVLGWYGHEVQWRGQTTELLQRKNDIDGFYGEKTSVDKLRDIIEGYSIDWIIYGPAERQQYAIEEVNPHLEELTQVVFENDQVIILQVVP